MKSRDDYPKVAAAEVCYVMKDELEGLREYAERMQNILVKTLSVPTYDAPALNALKSDAITVLSEQQVKGLWKGKFP